MILYISSEAFNFVIYRGMHLILLVQNGLFFTYSYISNFEFMQESGYPKPTFLFY